MYSSNNTKSLNLAVLLSTFVIFYFNICMSGFIKGSSYLSIIVVGALGLSFVLTANEEVQNKYFSLVRPLIFCIAWLAVLFLLGKSKQLGESLSLALRNCLYLAMVTYIYAQFSQPGKAAERKFIANFWLADTVLSCVYSIYRLEEDTELSRYLATSEESREELLAGIDFRGVVGYTVVYGILFLLPFLVQHFLKGGNRGSKGRLLAAIIAVIFLVTIIQAQFSLAIIIALVLVFYSLVLKNTQSGVNVVIFIILSLLVLFFAPRIIELILSTDILKDTTEIRMREILDWFNNENMEGSDLSTRLSLYSDSIKVIFETVFCGRAIIKTTTEVGGHSEFLDAIANFGLIYAVMLISFFVGIYKETRKKILDEYRTNYFIIQIVMLFLSVVNTSMLMPIPMILTVIVPFYIMDNDYDGKERLQGVAT